MSAASLLTARSEGGGAPPRPVIAGYPVERQVGLGRFSTVFAARDPRSDAPVALKVTPAGGHAYASLRARIKREARIAARLEGEGLICTRAWGQLDDGISGIWQVMALVEGATPLDLLGGERVDRLLRLRQAAGLVGRLHAQGVVHRDLKPANFLQAPDGRVALCDFGLAKELGEREEPAADDDPTGPLTHDGDPLGTAPYMAPEQFHAPGSAGPAADVYSLGVMLFLLLTNRLPYRGSPFEIRDQHERVRRGEIGPPDPGDHVPDVSAALVGVCRQALNLDPAARFRDGDAFAAAFDLALRAEAQDELRVGLTQARGNAWPAAEASFTRALRLGGESAPALHARGVVRTLLGRLPAARQDLARAAEVAPERPYLRFHAGIAAFLDRDWDGTAAAMEDVLAAGDLPLARYLRAVARFGGGALAEAAADARAALERDPSLGEAHLLLGHVHLRQGDLEEAERAYDRALALCPYAEGHNDRGVVRMRRGDLEGATADFTVALARRPRLALAHGNRSLALLRRAAADALCSGDPAGRPLIELARTAPPGRLHESVPCPSVAHTFPWGAGGPPAPEAGRPAPPAGTAPARARERSAGAAKAWRWLALGVAIGAAAGWLDSRTGFLAHLEPAARTWAAAMGDDGARAARAMRAALSERAGPGRD